MARAPALQALAGSGVQCVAQPERRTIFDRPLRAKVLAKTGLKTMVLYLRTLRFSAQTAGLRHPKGRRMGGRFSDGHILHASAATAR